MQYRVCGRTGWRVSEIAFGGWQLGGDWGPVDDAESIKTLHHPYAQGINFVDTAELYGSGHSEEVIGAHTLFRGERFTETLGRVNRLKKLCAPYYSTLAEAAIRDSLSPATSPPSSPGCATPPRSTSTSPTPTTRSSPPSSPNS